jgi:hypothetical protein
MAPCANPDPFTGCSNSTLFGARLAPCGTDSRNADDLLLIATALPPNAPALLFAGDASDSSPLGYGRLCVGGALMRLQVKQSMSGEPVYRAARPPKPIAATRS